MVVTLLSPPEPKLIGLSPKKAANCRPFLNTFGSVSKIVIFAAVSFLIPGAVRAWLGSDLLSTASKFTAILLPLFAYRPGLVASRFPLFSTVLRTLPYHAPIGCD